MEHAFPVAFELNEICFPQTASLQHPRSKSQWWAQRESKTREKNSEQNKTFVSIEWWYIILWNAKAKRVESGQRPPHHHHHHYQLLTLKIVSNIKHFSVFGYIQIEKKKTTQQRTTNAIAIEMEKWFKTLNKRSELWILNLLQ